MPEVSGTEISGTDISPAVIRSADSRRTTTPNGTATTLASPAQGGTGVVVWRQDFLPGAAGPEHAYDTEQVWTVLDGRAVVEMDGEACPVGPGDTLVLPAGMLRRVLADPEAGVSALVVTPAGTRVYRASGPAGVNPGVAVADGDRLIPAWVV
jgi:quercetin dioxygenase-like cupin family protein